MKDKSVPEESAMKGVSVFNTPRLLRWISTSRQFLRYCLVGGINTLIDLAVLNALLWFFPTTNALVLVGYNSIAYMSGAVSSFFFNKYWTFRYAQKTTRKELIRFAITLFLEVLYSNGLLWLISKALQPWITNVTLWGNASKLLTVIGGTIISFLFMRFWTFANGSRDHTKEQRASQIDNHERDTTGNF